MSEPLADQLAATALYAGNADFIEDLYERFLKDPAAVDASWARYFRGLPAAGSDQALHRPIRERLSTKRRTGTAAGKPAGIAEAASAKQGAVSRLIQIYANRGHLIAR